MSSDSACTQVQASGIGDVAAESEAASTMVTSTAAEEVTRQDFAFSLHTVSFPSSLLLVAPIRGSRHRDGTFFRFDRLEGERSGPERVNIARDGERNFKNVGRIQRKKGGNFRVAFSFPPTSTTHFFLFQLSLGAKPPLQLPPVVAAAAASTAASRVDGWLSASAEASGPAAAAATALAAAEVDAKAASALASAAAAAAAASTASLRPPLPACWRARARAAPGAGALARLTIITTTAAATATAAAATTAASAPPASVAAPPSVARSLASSLPSASPFARHASTPFEASEGEEDEDMGEGGAEPTAPAPAPAAASAGGPQRRVTAAFSSDPAPPLLLAPLERVGGGNAHAWDCSEDYGCNSSDSEWYREDNGDDGGGGEEEEEDERQKPAAAPSADLLLPWDFL